MTRERFDELVHRIERKLASRPVALRVRVAFMIALAYAGFLFGFLLVFLVGLLFFVGAVTLDSGAGVALLVVGSLLLTVSLWQAFSLLWVRIEPQPGREVRAGEAPRLFEMLETIRASVGAPAFDQVLITAEFNAGIQQIPRLGVFGWSRNLLHLGLPLLECLSPGEFEAVIAHEFAHVSARHGRFGCWVCRLRRTWLRVFERLHAPAKSQLDRTARKVVVKFIDWFWPRFNAYAFVLSRVNECEADRFSAQWAGLCPTVVALWRIDCLGRRLEEKVWPDLWQLANAQAEPPADLVTRMTAVLAQPPAPDDASRWMDQAAQALTDHVDTHPSLADRLRALGGSVEQCRVAGYPGTAAPSAAEAFFGPSLPSLRQEVGQLWRKEVEETWRQRHARATSLQSKLETLEQSPLAPECDPERLWDKARATLGLGGPVAAEPLLRQLLALRPNHSAGNLLLGQCLLSRGQSEGEIFLNRILETEDDELIPDACDALAKHFQTAGRTEALEEVRRRLSRFEAALSGAQRERNSVSSSDRFLDHGLASEEISALVRVLGDQPDLASAYLVRKQLKHFPKQRLFVLCIRGAGGFLSWSRSERESALVARLIPLARLPGRVLIVAPLPGFRSLARKIMRTPSARIYPSPS